MPPKTIKSKLMNLFKSLGKRKSLPAVAFSLDWDGCIGTGKTIEDVLKNNEELIQQMAELAAKGTKVFIYIGSNRQNFSINIKNSAAHNSPSCFEGLKRITDEVNKRAAVLAAKQQTKPALATYVPATTLDIVKEVEPGVSLQEEEAKQRQFLSLPDTTSPPTLENLPKEFKEGYILVGSGKDRAIYYANRDKQQPPRSLRIYENNKKEGLINELSKLPSGEVQPLSFSTTTIIYSLTEHNPSIQSVTICDETKITQLYYQMHLFAAQHQGEKKVPFVFIDDRNDILDGLKKMFEKFPHRVPENIDLILEQHVPPEKSMQIRNEIDGLKEVNDLLVQMAEKDSPIPSDIIEKIMALHSTNSKLFNGSDIHSLKEGIQPPIAKGDYERLHKQLRTSITQALLEAEKNLEVFERSSISGQGEIDRNPRDTARAMWIAAEKIGADPDEDGTLREDKIPPIRDLLQLSPRYGTQEGLQNLKIGIRAHMMVQGSIDQFTKYKPLQIKINDCLQKYNQPSEDTNSPTQQARMALMQYMQNRLDAHQEYHYGTVRQILALRPLSGNYKSRTVKLQAAEKVLDFLFDFNKQLNLTASEKKALQDGELKTVMEKIQKAHPLPPDSLSDKTNMFRDKLRQIEKKPQQPLQAPEEPQPRVMETKL